MIYVLVATLFLSACGRTVGEKLNAADDYVSSRWHDVNSGDAETNVRVSQLEAENEEQQRQLDALKEFSVTTLQSIELLSTAVHELEDKLDAKLGEVESAVLEMQRDASDLAEIVTANSVSIDDLNEATAVMVSNITALQIGLEDITTRVSALEADTDSTCTSSPSSVVVSYKDYSVSPHFKTHSGHNYVDGLTDVFVWRTITVPVPVITCN